MTRIIRTSPVFFDARPVETEERDGWGVVLSYEKEGGGPNLVDLSHRLRWDVQNKHVGDLTPAKGITIPDTPGEVTVKNGLLVNRMNGTQAAVWHLDGEEPQPPENLPMVTNVTEATCFLAIIGSSVFEIAEKLTNLDLGNPSQRSPRLVQGPFSHVPCQIVVFADKIEKSAILLTCSRGYSHDMTSAILEAGKAINLSPAGEKRFHSWFQSI